MDYKWKVGVLISLLPFAIGWVSAKGETKYREGQSERSIAHIREAVDAIVISSHQREEARIIRAEKDDKREREQSKQMSDLTTQVQIMANKQIDLVNSFDKNSNQIDSLRDEIGKVAKDVTEVKTNQSNIRKELSTNTHKIDGLTRKVTRIEVLQEERNG